MGFRVEISGYGTTSKYEIRSSDVDINTMAIRLLESYFDERSGKGAVLPVGISIDTRDVPEINAAMVNNNLNEYLNDEIIEKRMEQGVQGNVNIKILRYR